MYRRVAELVNCKEVAFLQRKISVGPRGKEKSAGLKRTRLPLSFLLIVLLIAAFVVYEAPRVADLFQTVRTELFGGARQDAGRVRAEVERVVDGDTIIVRLGGQRERVRYIGIDTPESARPDAPVECYGPEAASANARLLAGGVVLLEFDAERRDDYGRLLAYVYLPDGTFVNGRLVEEGYARAIVIPPNVKYATTLRNLERSARAAGRGLWGACR